MLAVERGPRSFSLAVETVPSLAGSPSCVTLATSHGRRKVLIHDPPCAGVPVQVVWHKRTYRCLEDACEALTFSKVYELAAPRGMLTTRAITWAMTHLCAHGIAVSALAEMLRVA